MSIKSDRWIRRMAQDHRMIEPFADAQVRAGVISYGLSSYGYDMRVTRTFRVFSPVHCQVLDVKDFPLAAYQEVEAGTVLIPPNSFALGSSVERFRIPRDVLALCVGKSSYARMGIIINVTPLEPEWEGHVTIEISNTAPLPARVHHQVRQ